MSIGKRIQTLRKDNNMSQDQLAQKCNVSRQTISRWENDEVVLDTNNLITLSKIFNKSLDEIVFGKEKEKTMTKTKKSKSKVFIGILLVFSILFNSIFVINYLINNTNNIYGTWSYQEDGYDITLIIEEIEEEKPTYKPVGNANKPNSYSSIEVYKYFLNENTNIKQEYDSKLTVHHIQDDKEIGLKYRIIGSKDEIYYDKKTNTLILKCTPFRGKNEFKLEKIK